MVKAIIAGQPPHEVLKLTSRRLKASREEIFDALQGELTESYYFVLDELMQHIEEIEARIARFDTKLLDELKGTNETRWHCCKPCLVSTLLALLCCWSKLAPTWIRLEQQTNSLLGSAYARATMNPPATLRVRSCRQSYQISVQIEVPVSHCPAWI